ncbi:FAD/NAD(P)-binding domain-containing protein [Daedalea quercina L-15889]|uniref:FAD/NAD(P)-binding domain-containing protein n=1 Tax=Daedalea quercina L-15889 TaxID=1314783 RepID=A0A165QKB2_9APHY|nr:FAD/NAD(P)-binding domain-containing protein [Daedalea quercina L-15889]
MARKTVVVLGGGWTGSLAARQLSAQLDPRRYELVLVNDRPYAINLIAGARMTVTSVDNLDSKDKGLLPYDKLFQNGNGSVKIGHAVAVEEDKESGKGGWVILEGGEKVRWDALVVATGSAWQGPLSFPDAGALPGHVQQWRERVKGANDIYIVGGGAVGIEFAGEIKEAYPDKKVTLIHSGPKLLTSVYPDKYRDDIEKRARARGINFAFNEYVDSIPEPGVRGLTTRKGTQFDTADLVIPAFGSRPNTAVVSSLAPSPISANGSLKVNPTLEVQDHPGIFALGDVVDWKEEKQAAKGTNHIAVVVPNLVSYLEGKPLKKVYKGSPELILIPLGKSGGSAYLGILWGIVLGDWFARMVKGKDLFVSQSRKDRGL